MEYAQDQVIVNKAHGLHARPATIFVQLANKFNSSVQVCKDEEKVDGKSIIAILSLGINKGMKISIVTEGGDSKEALAELKKFLEAEDD